MTMSADASVSARFDPPPPGPTQHALTVTVVGQGRVTSPTGIDCASTCTASFADGASVALTASAASGWQFSSWSGACNVARIVRSR